MPSPTIRSDIPGVFRRGTRFYVSWRDAQKKQHWESCSTMEQAISFKESKAGHKDEVRATLLRAERQARVRLRADLTDAYGFVRQALQSVDRARLPKMHEDAIHAALADAEDGIKLAMRMET